MVNRTLLQHAEIGLCIGSPQRKPFVKVNGYPQIGNPPRSMMPKSVKRVSDGILPCLLDMEQVQVTGG